MSTTRHRFTPIRSALRRSHASWLAAGLLAAFSVPAMAATIEVTTTDQASQVACTLGDAIQAANTDAAVGSCPAGADVDTIMLPPNAEFTFDAPSPLNMSSALPATTSKIVIEGNGAILRRLPEATDFRIMMVAGGDLTLNRVTVAGGFSNIGGGILNNKGTLNLNNSTVSNNHAEGFGGGIFNGRGVVRVQNSTVSQNFATQGGGGIYSYTAPYSSPSETSELTEIRSSTISGNGTGLAGGGIYNHYGQTRIVQSTVTANSSVLWASVVSSGDTNTRTEISGTLIAANLWGDIATTGTFNSFASLGDNVVGTGNAISAFDKVGDQVNVTDPGVGPLEANGGPTHTHELLAHSPAINAVTLIGNCQPADQRGVPRPDGIEGGSGTCDIGAFEHVPLADVCPLASGDWKATPTGNWSLEDLALGMDGVYSVSAADAMKLLKESKTSGNATLILAQQLIAALLNEAAGAKVPTEVAQAIVDGRAAITAAGGPDKPVKTSSGLGKTMVSVAETLQAFNHGKLTAGCEPVEGAVTSLE